MRRLALIAVALAALGAAGAATASGGGGGDYRVRAIFDNGGFVVPGEDVRIAGAKVGSVSEVGVTLPGDWVNADHSSEPGKAFVVMTIDDPGFQSWRQDASCLIRPQSLLGEKYIDCTPTQPRAPGTPPRPPLETIPSGQPGAGERFLPLQNNGKQVDLDLVQDIQRLPYAQRLTLILNDLGAGLAARGRDLNAVIRRADPALRYTDEVLAILARQNRQLAQLARDSATVLGPLARERRHVSGFIASAGATARATAERSADLESGIRKLPHFLAELRSTMNRLHGFAATAQPVVADLGAAAPSITRATKALGPFSGAATTSLRSLGDAAQASGQKIRAADPVLRQINALAHAARSPSRNLKRLLGSLRETGGFKRLATFIYNSLGSLNGFDSMGHFVRAELIATNCVDYVTSSLSGCNANFLHSSSAKAKNLAKSGPPSLRAVKRLLDYTIGRRPGASRGGPSGADVRGGGASGSGGVAP